MMDKQSNRWKKSILAEIKNWSTYEVLGIFMRVCVCVIWTY